MSKSVESEVETYEVQPILCIAGIVVVSTLVGLTAGLPLNLPSHQFYIADATLNSGDTAWTLISTVFGLFLSPAVAYLYSLLRNVTSLRIVQLVVLTSSLITFVWILFTYSLCYGKDVGRFISDPGTFYMFRDTYGQGASQVGASSVPSAIVAVYELGFPILSATLVACSLAGRVSTMGFLFFILVWHIVVYCPIAHMMWTHQGWFHQHHIEDFSGGLVVHMLGGLTAFCAHSFLGRDDMPNFPPVLNASETLKMAFLVWFLWFGYTAGKAHSAGPVAAQAVVNVFAGTMSSVLISFFYELIYERNITPISITTALLLGLVAITPAAGYVSVGGAMCIGIFTYLVTALVANHLYCEGVTLNSPLSIITVHGLGGTVGFLSTAILSYKFINPAAFNGATWGNGKPILYHFILCLLFYTCATASIFLVLYVCDKIVPFKTSLNREAEYPDFSLVLESQEENVPPEVTGSVARAPSTRMASSRRIGLSRRIEASVSQRMQFSRSARSGLTARASSRLTGGASSPTNAGKVDRTLSVGPLGANKSFRSEAMQDLELTQSSTMK